MGTPLLPAPALLLGPAAAGEAASGHVQPPRRYAGIYKMHTNKMHVDRYSYTHTSYIHLYFSIYQVLYSLWCPLTASTTWGSHPAASSTPTLVPGCPPRPASPSTDGQNEAQKGWRGPHSTRIARQDLFSTSLPGRTRGWPSCGLVAPGARGEHGVLSLPATSLPIPARQHEKCF